MSYPRSRSWSRRHLLQILLSHEDTSQILCIEHLAKLFLFSRFLQQVILFVPESVITQVSKVKESLLSKDYQVSPLACTMREDSHNTYPSSHMYGPSGIQDLLINLILQLLHLPLQLRQISCHLTPGSNAPFVFSVPSSVLANQAEGSQFLVYAEIKSTYLRHYTLAMLLSLLQLFTGLNTVLAINGTNPIEFKDMSVSFNEGVPRLVLA